MADVFAAGTLSTMKVKELCRRQLLAKTSAASEKVMAVNQPPSCSSGLLATSPATPSFSAVVSPQASPAYIAPSPSAISLQQRSPSVAADEQVRRSVVESSWPMDTVSTRPSPLIWHMPTASSVNSVSGVNINRSPRPASNSADSSDGTTSQQFTMVCSTQFVFVLVPLLLAASGACSTGNRCLDGWMSVVKCFSNRNFCNLSPILTKLGTHDLCANIQKKTRYS